MIKTLSSVIPTSSKDLLPVTQLLVLLNYYFKSILLVSGLKGLLHLYLTGSGENDKEGDT